MILVLLLILFVDSLNSACPPCVKYQNPLPRHYLGFEMTSDNCMCEQELTKCAIINPVCPQGKQCVVKPIPVCTFPPCQLQSAVCEPFTACAEISCPNKCDKSGYLKDPNNCQTCVCQNPCSETTCKADEKCVTVIEIGGGQTARCDKKEACPPCVITRNPYPTHLIGTEINADGCACTHNLTLCSDTKPLCPAGKQCVVRPLPDCTFKPCKLESAICETFTNCPLKNCSSTCSTSGFVKDQNGCQTCSCNEPCKEITCPSDKKCVIVIEIGGGQYGRCDAKEPCPPCVKSDNPLPVHVQGIEINADGCRCYHNLTRCSTVEPVCPKGKQCVLKNLTTCTFQPCKMQSAVCEPFTQCPSVSCNVTCSKSGYLKDPNGCQTCDCNEPCQEITCPSDKKCVTVIQTGGGKFARCDPKEACPPCVASNNNLPIHALGTETNSDGCKCPHNLTRCAIVEPVCPKGQQCTLKPLSKCTFTPCRLYSAVCEPFTECSQPKCSTLCPVSGYIFDPNGCQTCVCKAPCKETICPEDQKCVTMIEVGGGQFAKCFPK